MQSRVPAESSATLVCRWIDHLDASWGSTGSDLMGLGWVQGFVFLRGPRVLVHGPHCEQPFVLLSFGWQYAHFMSYIYEYSPSESSVCQMSRYLMFCVSKLKRKMTLIMYVFQKSNQHFYLFIVFLKLFNDLKNNANNCSMWPCSYLVFWIYEHLHSGGCLSLK